MAVIRLCMMSRVTAFLLVWRTPPEKEKIANIYVYINTFTSATISLEILLKIAIASTAAFAGTTPADAASYVLPSY